MEVTSTLASVLCRVGCVYDGFRGLSRAFDDKSRHASCLRTTVRAIMHSHALERRLHSGEERLYLALVVVACIS